MNISEVRKIVGKIKGQIFKNANQVTIGMLKSNFRGTGLQFREHQVYTFGDDVRFIDWKILAKTNSPYIKTFQEERNVEIVVVIDASETMLMGYRGVSKLQAAIEICCLLYLISKETNDAVHAIIVSDEVIHVPKKSGEEGVSFLIAMLEEKQILDKNGKVNLNRTFKRKVTAEELHKTVLKHLHRKKEIVFLSDFGDFLEKDIIKKLIFNSHVHLFQIICPLDLADKMPYSIFSKAGEKTGLFKFNLGGKKEFENKYGKRFKRLNVSERYLEKFVREMV